MKILLMGFSKLKYMPYIHFYLDAINCNSHQVHVVYWNRDLKEEPIDEYGNIVLHEFKKHQLDNVAKYSKIFSFIQYRRFVLNIMRNESFDFIISLHSMPSVLLKDILRKKYREKYIFDYRDITYENNYLYKKIIHDLVRFSKVTFVSSNGFRGVLPQEESNKILTTHNINTNELSCAERKCSDNKCIRIAFWGYIREESFNKVIISKISKDTRFELHYYGREQNVAKNLKEYVKQIGADNIFFHGEYLPKDIMEFSRNVDMIHNLYSSQNMMLAMSNKFYDGICLEIPQLCMNGSIMGKRIETSRIGIVCNPYDENFTDIIYKEFSKINRKEFSDQCKREKKHLLVEYENARSVIEEMFN